MLDHKDIQVVCIKNYVVGIKLKEGGIEFEDGKIYYGYEYIDESIINIRYNKNYVITLDDGEKNPVFKKHFRFFTG